jgi:hypothetical protein
LTEEWFILLWLVILLTITLLIFDKGVVHIAVAVTLFPITISGLTEEWSILLWLVILLTITV